MIPLGDTVLLVGIGSAFLSLLLVFGYVMTRSRDDAGVRRLRDELELDDFGEADDPATSSVLRQAAGVLDRLHRDEERTEELQARLDSAGSKLRASEHRVVQAVLALVGALVGGVLLGSMLFGGVLAVVAGMAPTVLLDRRVRKRGESFERQLPDVLQLLASSLRAGYGFLQAIDTAATEAAEPAATEFTRVVTEARLGGSVEQALEAMAERLDSPDFRWVVIAVNIQRQVGGNLAELLETVAETIRERERLRRHVKALSAEGRMSAWILFTLPFLVSGWILLVNPTYFGVLLESNGGMIAIGIMLVFMALGVVWVKKIIRIAV